MLEGQIWILQLGFVGLTAMIAFRETRQDHVAAVLFYALVPSASFMLYAAWWLDSQVARARRQDAHHPQESLLDRAVLASLLTAAIVALCLAVYEAAWLAEWPLPVVLLVSGGPSLFALLLMRAVIHPYLKRKQTRTLNEQRRFTWPRTT